jgi:hypothetical protein
MTKKDQTYRIEVTAPAWVGKPDPNGFGFSYLYSDDYAWLQECGMQRAQRGCRAQFQKRDEEGRYYNI